MQQGDMHKVPGPSMRGTFTQLPRPGWTTTATSTCFIASVSTSMHSYNRRWLAIWGVGGGVSSCFMKFLEVFLCETRVAGGKVFWTPRPTPRQLSRAKSLVGMNLWKFQGETIFTSNMQKHPWQCPTSFFVMSIFPSEFSICIYGESKTEEHLMSWVLDLKFHWLEGFFLIRMAPTCEKSR